MERSPGEHLDRRAFLRDAALGAAGAGAVLAGCPKRPPEQAPPQPSTPTPTPTAATGGSQKSRVVVARHPGITRGGEVQEDALGKAVDEALMALSGQDSPQKAWEQYFSSDEVIGIKVNGLGGPLISTSPVLSKVCVERLQGIGVRPESIIIWDSNEGFLANCGLQMPAMWGAQVLTMGVEWDRVFEQGAFRGPITAIVTRRVDSFLNLPILKDHSISGITLAMKNHYGSHQNPGDHHRNGCDPYIADLNAIPAIRDKQRLILCDASRGQAQGGPGYNAQYAWNPNLILAATDRVAHDTVGWGILETKRTEFGLSPIAPAGSMPRQLVSAAERGLGTNDPTRIDRVELDLA